MHPRVVAGLIALSCGCAHSYTAVSYDVSHQASGTMTAMADGGRRNSGSLAFGFGGRGASMEIAVHAQDLETRLDPWLAASAGLELKLSLLHQGPVTGFIHGGPMRGAIVDSQTGDVTWGAGLDYGGGLGIGGRRVRGFVDVRSEQIFYAGDAMGATDGNRTQRTVSIGMQFGGD